MGCEAQKREVHEAVELPLTQPELFACVGVDPPHGVLLCGLPGTDKTMLSWAAVIGGYLLSGPLPLLRLEWRWVRRRVVSR
jgi:SpoVK/Ycf46/Vps4 family AAA+-type ATPase